MEWIKKQLTKPTTYIILFVISLVIPVIINEAYKFGQNCEHAYITMWRAEDALSFFGNYLSFFGTIILGAVAVFQTEKANEKTDSANIIASDALKQAERSNQLAQDALVQAKISNELSAQMQKLEHAKFMPMISVEKLYVNRRSINSPNYHTPEINNPILFDMVDIEYWNFSNCYHVDVIFENISDYPIVELNVQAKGCSGDAHINHGLKPACNDVYISPHGKQPVRFIIPAHFFDEYPNDNLCINLEFINVFDFHTFATIRINSLPRLSANMREGFTYRILKVNDVNPLEFEELPVENTQ